MIEKELVRLSPPSSSRTLPPVGASALRPAVGRAPRSPRGPPSSARRGSYARTSRGRSGAPRSATYGTTAVTTSTRPRPARAAAARRDRPERLHAVPAGTRDGGGIHVGSDHGRSRACRAEDDGDRPAAGAQVDRDAGRRQQRRRPAGQCLGLRARHEHAGVDTNASVAEPHRTGDPRERLSGEPASEQLLDGSDPRVRGVEQRVGLGRGVDATTRGEHVEDARPLLAQGVLHGRVRVVC